MANLKSETQAALWCFDETITPKYRVGDVVWVPTASENRPDAAGTEVITATIQDAYSNNQSVIYVVFDEIENACYAINEYFIVGKVGEGT